MKTKVAGATGFAIHQERMDLMGDGKPVLVRNGVTMKFANGYAVSVQCSHSNYCTEHNDGTADDAEIAVIGPNGEWATRGMWAGAFGDDCGDDVVGHVTVDQLTKLMVHIQEWVPCE